MRENRLRDDESAGAKSRKSVRFVRRAAGILILFAALAGWHSSAAKPVPAADASPDPSTCHPRALATSDNDIRLDHDDRPPGKPVAIAAPVIERLQTAARSLLAQVPPGTADGMTCDDLFPHIYRISVPEHRELFVAEIYVGVGIGYFYLIVHDSMTGAVTRDPPRIGAKSPQTFGAADRLVKKPFVSTADLFGNHQPQIVFEERVHNGTMYNAVVYHYFDVRPDLGLTRVLAHETRLMALQPDGAIFIRELTPLNPTHLRLDTFELLSPDAAQRKEMGYVILESPGPGTPFRVVERHPTDSAHFNGHVRG
jgi:hypothetical protein